MTWLKNHLRDKFLAGPLAAAARDAGLESIDLLRRFGERLAARKERPTLE
jgi:hypothetical protein